jgi:hypothetical protein
MMRRAILPIIALSAIAACGRKGARSADFDSATAAALASGPTPAMAAMPKIPHVIGFELGHRLDRHDMVYGGPAQQFLPGDSILLSVRVIYVDSGTSTRSTPLEQKAGRRTAPGPARWGCVSHRPSRWSRVPIRPTYS